jgi:hypothetical protein
MISQLKRAVTLGMVASGGWRIAANIAKLPGPLQKPQSCNFA